MDEQEAVSHEAASDRRSKGRLVVAGVVGAVLATGGIVWAVTGQDGTPSAASQPGTPTGPSGTAATSTAPSTSTTGATDGSTTDGTSPTVRPDATPTSTGPRAPDPTDPPEEMLSDRIEDVLTKVKDVLATPAPDPSEPADLTDLEDVAGGTYLSAIQAAAAEYADLGWRQTGAPTVESVKIVEEHLDGTPPTVVAEACIDSSGVDIVDDEGSLRGAGTPDRTLNLLTLELTGGVWHVVGQTFPKNPDC